MDHLGVVVGVLGQLMRSTWWFLSLCKIWEGIKQ